jgi:hypothetical protein
MSAEGKELQLRVFEASPTASYEEIAKKENIPLHDVRNYIARTKGRLRELVIQRVSEYVVSAKEIEDEMQQLAQYLNR